VTTCPSGSLTSQSPNICYQCDASCLTCVGPSPNQCATCNGASSLTPSGTCGTCPNGFFSNNRNVCVACPNGCTACTSATSCQTSNCLAGQSFINGQCQQCLTGTGSAAGAAGACTITCAANCVNCDTALSCLQSSCSAGSYLDSSNTCVSCTGSTGSQAGSVGTTSCSFICGSPNCVTCGVSLTGTKTCLASNCAEGQYLDPVSFTCISCTGGKGSAVNSLSCTVSCTVSNCDSCTATTPGTCLKCQAGYYLNGVSCSQCSGGQGSTTGGTCSTTCSTGCSACAVSPSGVQTCITSGCLKGQYFDNAQ
jgi:proprotein convertase subtilisin/kexin type 5